MSTTPLIDKNEQFDFSKFALLLTITHSTEHGT